MNTDFSDTVQAKSDQMNAEDFSIGSKVFTILRAEKHKDSNGSPNMHIFFEESKLPYIPSKGYRKIIMIEMGASGSGYVGKKLELDLDPTVTFGKSEVGGICIIGMSAINKKTRHRVRLNRSQYKFVDLHPIKTDFYNDDKFAEKMPAVSGAIQNGKMTNEQAIMQLEKTAPLTDAQKQQVNKIELTPTVKETK